jgi:putative phage-type endonuclease
MITLDVPQLSDEWFEARVGNPGASSFDKIVTSEGAPSIQSDQYMRELAGEILLGQKEEHYQNAAMQRGIELEGEARAFFELKAGITVQQVGLVYPDEDKMYHCSPDGLMGECGLEIKCPALHTHVDYLLRGKLPTKYIAQVQGSMLVTGFQFWYFLSYYPGIKSLLICVERDDAFCDKLEKELDRFCDGLVKMVKKLMTL